MVGERNDFFVNSNAGRLRVFGFASRIQDDNGTLMKRGLIIMGFFQRIGNALARFMYGRNGMDQLNRALFIGYLGICVLRAVLASALQNPMFVSVSEWVLLPLSIVILFRMFSKNLYKRREENQKWLNFVWKIKNNHAGAKARHADKDHKYFTCKKCKAICRVPVGKGKIIITCPKCGEKIEART